MGTVSYTHLDVYKRQGINGADFGTSELICPYNIIINGFHFPYPLNGTQIVQCQEDFDDD